MKSNGSFDLFRGQGVLLGDDHEAPGLVHDLLEEFDDDVVGKGHTFLGNAQLWLHFLEHAEDVCLETV